MVLDKLWDKYAVDARQRKIKIQTDIIVKRYILLHVGVYMMLSEKYKNMYAGNKRVKTMLYQMADPATGESNFNYEYSGFTKEFFEDQQLLMDEISYRCLYKQEPIEREGLLFPDDKIRRYLNLPHGEPRNYHSSM